MDPVTLINQGVHRPGEYVEVKFTCTTLGEDLWWIVNDTPLTFNAGNSVGEVRRRKNYIASLLRRSNDQNLRTSELIIRVAEEINATHEVSCCNGTLLVNKTMTYELNNSCEFWCSGTWVLTIQYGDTIYS